MPISKCGWCNGKTFQTVDVAAGSADPHERMQVFQCAHCGAVLGVLGIIRVDVLKPVGPSGGVVRKPDRKVGKQ